MEISENWVREKKFVKCVGLTPFDPDGVEQKGDCRMTMLRQKIENELDVLDNRSMAAVYEQLRQLNFARRTTVKRRNVARNIEDVLRLTSCSKESWSETVVSCREERV